MSDVLEEIERALNEIATIRKENKRLQAVVDAAVRVSDWAATTWVPDYWPDEFVRLNTALRALDGEP